MSYYYVLCLQLVEFIDDVMLPSELTFIGNNNFDRSVVRFFLFI